MLDPKSPSAAVPSENVEVLACVCGTNNECRMLTYPATTEVPLRLDDSNDEMGNHYCCYSPTTVGEGCDTYDNGIMYDY